MGFHSPRFERPQEKLVPNLLLIPSIPCSISLGSAVLCGVGFGSPGGGWASYQDLRRL